MILIPNDRQMQFLLHIYIFNRLSGLIVDVFGDAAVIASSAAWVEKYRAEIELHLSRISNLNNLIWRQSIEVLKEEGLDFTRHQKDNSPSALFKKLKVSCLVLIIIKLRNIPFFLCKKV